MSLTDQLHVGPMQRSQLRAIMKIDKQVYPEPWSKALWVSELDRGSAERVYLVAHNQQALVAYAGMLRIHDEAHVVTIVTDPARQQRGVGSVLMMHLCRQAITWGCTALTLEVRASNKAAQALYRRFGLAPVGVRKGYYAPDEEDALIMSIGEIDQPDFAQRLAKLSEGITPVGEKQ